MKTSLPYWFILLSLIALHRHGSQLSSIKENPRNNTNITLNRNKVTNADRLAGVTMKSAYQVLMTEPISDGKNTFLANSVNCEDDETDKVL